METKRFAADPSSTQKSAIYELLHVVQEMEASHLPFSLTPCQHDLGVGRRLAALAFATRGLSLRARFAKDARASRSRAGLRGWNADVRLPQFASFSTQFRRWSGSIAFLSTGPTRVSESAQDTRIRVEASAWRHSG